MAEPLSGSFGKPFPEQVAAFRLRLGNLVPTSAWDDIQKAAHDRAFVVAGATKADLLADLGEAVDRAIADGEGIDQFRKRFREIVKRHGWHGWTGEGTKAGEAWRTRVIYRTNIATSYAAGRRAQLLAGNFPFWVYRHSGAENPRLWHLAWDGLTLPPDHPFWITHTPVNGWGCGCYVLGARSRRAARRLGGDPDKPLPANWNKIDPKTGEPIGIGKGWGYAPGGTVGPTIQLAAKKLRDLPALLGAEFGADVNPILARAWPIYIADTQAAGSHEVALAGSLIPDLIKALQKRGRAPQNAAIHVRPGLVKGPKATRHETKGDALADAEWDQLPALLARPVEIYLDTRTENVVHILSDAERLIQVTIRMDLDRRVRRDSVTLNQILSAYIVSRAQIASKVRQKRFERLL